MIIIEEHHEEVIHLYKHIKKNQIKSPISLIHVDEHADMFSPIISEKKLQFNSLKDVKEMVYEELRISDFLLTLFYNNMINEVLWISNETKHIDFAFNIKKVKSYNQKIQLMMDFKARTTPYVYCQTNIFHESVTLENKNVILTIDLDYFTCDDNEGESVEIEITENEYLNMLKNKFHPIRLSYGSRASINQKKNGKYILRIQEYFDSNNKKIDNHKIILEKIANLGKYLAKMNIKPELTIICKSCISGYVSSEDANFILENLHIIEKYIELEN